MPSIVADEYTAIKPPDVRQGHRRSRRHRARDHAEPLDQLVAAARDLQSRANDQACCSTRLPVSRANAPLESRMTEFWLGFSWMNANTLT
jgi:hypothetical protein